MLVNLAGLSNAYGIGVVHVGASVAEFLETMNDGKGSSWRQEHHLTCLGPRLSKDEKRRKRNEHRQALFSLLLLLMRSEQVRSLTYLLWLP